MPTTATTCLKSIRIVSNFVAVISSRPICQMSVGDVGVISKFTKKNQILMVWFLNIELPNRLYMYCTLCNAGFY